MPHLLSFLPFVAHFFKSQLIFVKSYLSFMSYFKSNLRPFFCLVIIVSIAMTGKIAKNGRGIILIISMMMIIRNMSTKMMITMITRVKWKTIGRRSDQTGLQGERKKFVILPWLGAPSNKSQVRFDVNWGSLSSVVRGTFGSSGS